MNSTTGSETDTFGPFFTSNWQSSDFQGTSSRQWSDTANSFNFAWNTNVGDQIGSIGVQYGSSYLQNSSWQGVKISAIPPSCTMSTNAAWTPANNNWFYWSIYGWTNNTYTYWGSANAPNGFDNEFYIIFYTQMTPAAILAQPGCVSKGSVTVDGMTFDCYETPRVTQSQWLAVCTTGTWNTAPSIQLAPIFDYWCSQGMSSSQYVESLSWALEGFSPSAGTLQLTNTVIPNLEAAAVVPEPGTLALLGVAVCGAAAYQCARSRRIRRAPQRQFRRP